MRQLRHTEEQELALVPKEFRTSMHDLPAFVLAVLSHWVALMSGVVSLVLTFLLRTRRKDISDRWFWLIAVCFLLFASFLAWRDEHRSLIKTAEELAEERDPNTPRLNGKIEQVKVGKSTDSSDAQVLIHLSVRNTGSQSIAEGFELGIKSVDFEDHDTPSDIAKDYSLLPLDKSPKLTLGPQDSLTHMTAKPIERGSLARGWLRFAVTGARPERLWRPGMKYTVSFADVLGKTYTAEYLVPEDAR